MSDNATLVKRIKKSIAAIPAGGGGYISFENETLRDKLTDGLLEKIAETAASEAAACIAELEAERDAAWHKFEKRIAELEAEIARLQATWRTNVTIIGIPTP